MRATTLALAAALAAAAPACNQIIGNTDPTGPHNDAHPDAPSTCTAGQMFCNGNELQTCVDGTFQDTQACPNACTSELGCVLCAPGTGTCNGNVSHACNAQGTGYDDITCDPVQGLSCGATGVCEGACAAATLGATNLGCEFYPTVTGNAVGADWSFAVAIANPGATTANVVIEDGGLTAPTTLTVGPGSVAIQKLPWQLALKLCSGTMLSCQTQTPLPTPSVLATKGAFHLRSDQPVAVYQFNPIDYSDGNGNFSYTNDASLLEPAHTWRTEYYAASWVSVMELPTELAVTASHDNTIVTLETRADTVAAGGAPAFTTGTPGMVVLNAGDVLEISAHTGDLSGTHVTSDKPVELISAHYCADVPDTNTGYCDHLEESTPPVAALGARYVVVAPAVTTIPNGKVEAIRVIATEPGTTLTYDPPQPGEPAAIANAGDHIDLVGTANSFVLTANHKVLVAQYMEGQVAGGNTGDPSLSFAVPVEQFRTSYLFHAPTNYEVNFVDVIAPMGATVSLDAQALTFSPIGTTGFGVARVAPLGKGPGNDGNHSILGSAPFGISVYGYGQYTSYWYPGGMSLAELPAP